MGPVIGGGLIDTFNNVVSAVSVFALGALVLTVLCLIAYITLYGEYLKIDKQKLESFVSDTVLQYI